MSTLKLKRIIVPIILLLACIVGLFFTSSKQVKAESSTVSCSYEADFTNGLPYDWLLYGRSDTDATVTPSVATDGALKLGSTGGPKAEYYGTVYRFATGLSHVTDFTLEFEFKFTSSIDNSRWIALLYHAQLNYHETDLNQSKWISGYGAGIRVDGRNHQTTVTHNMSADTIEFTDSCKNPASTIDWNNYHKLIVKAEGNQMSHYFDSTDNLLCTYNIADTAYSNLLTPQTHGEFALVINQSEIQIKSVNITATRDSRYIAKTPGDNSTPLSSFNTAGLKSYTAVVSEINSAEDASALSTNGADSSLFYLKSGNTIMQSANGTDIPSLTLGDIGFAVLSSSQSSYPKYNGTYPIIYVKDQQGANTLTSYMSSHYTSHNETIRLAMMTDDPALLKSMRTSFNRVRGMLDWSGTTVSKNATAWQNVVSTTNGSLATTAVLSEADATPEAVDYIQKRGITVWVKQSNYSETDTASIMATGAAGIITSNVSATISARDLFASDVNALTRAPLNIAHRGMSMGFYPNTVEGCQASIASGATHVEIDLYVTIDNRVMVMHDDPLYVVCDCHTTACSDYISDMTYEQTKQFKVVKETNEFLFPATVIGEGVPIPTLDEMFAWAQTDPNALFYLELKPCDAGHGGGGELETTYNQRLIDAIKLCIDTYDIADQIVFITSHNDLASKAHAAMPGIALISTTGDNILANNNYYLDYWATINSGIDVNSGWANTKEFVSLGYLPNYWTYEIEHRVRENGYPVYLSYESAIISGVYGITNNYPFVFKNNARMLYLEGETITVADMNTLFANGVEMKYSTYINEVKSVNAQVFTYEQKTGYAEATFKATFTNDYGLQYTLYTPKYRINYTNVSSESTVTFDANGGTLTDSASVTIPTGETVSKPTDPTKAGFTFNGWTLNGNAFSFDFPIIGDVTLVATWCTQVTFDANGGTLNSDATLNVNQGATISKPENPARLNYIFKGWMLNGTAFDFNTPINEKITLVAEWVPFALSDYAYQANIDNTKNALSSVTATHATDWNSILVDMSAYISVIDNYMKSNALDFIHFDNHDFITYTDSNGNDKLFSVRFREKYLFVNSNGHSYVAGDILTIKAGFVWGDYQVKKDLTFVVKGINQGLQYQAQLSYTDITVSRLYVDKSTNYAWPSVQVHFSGVSGATFTQWQNCLDTMIIEYTTSAGVNMPVSDFTEITGEHDGSIFIIRLKNQQYVFANGDKISIYKNSYISVGEKAFRLTKDYHFVVDSASSGGYKVRTNTVTFNANGGTLTDNASKTVEHGALVSTTAPTKAADAQYTYTFNGWKLNGSAFDIATTPITESITLVADWTATPIYVPPTMWTITFNPNGGTFTGSTSVQVEDGQTVACPIAPTKEGYTFNGWQLNNSTYNFDTAVTSSIELVASWTANTPEPEPNPNPTPNPNPNPSPEQASGCRLAIGSVFIPSMIAVLGAGVIVTSKRRK